jgi:hypothetical protein
MLRKTLLVALAAGLAAASSAQAQDARFEISALAGWTFSDGVDGEAVSVPGEGTFNRIDPKDSFSWGLRFGYLLTENHEIGALFGMQPTELELSGTGTASLGPIPSSTSTPWLAPISSSASGPPISVPSM